MLSDRMIQLASAAVALAALTAGALLHQRVGSLRRELALDTATADESLTKDPKTALLLIAPGGLRAPLLTWLWIRSQQLKDEGRLYDAKQLRDLICDLMPHYPGVWAFHAWDMAWNISVMTHTAEERWMWVYNGLTLLRDKGLFYNPKDLVLYRELAWIFFSKMGQYTDEMHMVYKRRWAARMQRLLGAPPAGGSTEEAIADFREVAEAPPSLDDLQRDPDARSFLQTLGACGVEPDEKFLQLYNRFSPDPKVANFRPDASLGAVRGWYDEPTEGEKRLGQAIRAAWDDSTQTNRPALAKVLAFVRRKLLVEQYRMDPAWMLSLMEKYGPLDWRQVNAHAIYWATLGLNRAEGVQLKDMHPLNTGRTLLGGLKSLRATGLMYYLPNPTEPDDPFIDWQPDWRFIEPTHQAYIAAGEILAGGRDKLYTEANTLRDAHVVALEDAILQLYAGGREDLAQHYFEEMKTLLRPAGPAMELPLRDFIRARLMELGTPTRDISTALWYGALRAAYRALAGGNQSEFLTYHAFARRAYETFMQTLGQTPRLAEEAFQVEERNFLAAMLLQPEALNLQMPLLARVRLYRALPTIKRAAVYPLVAEELRRLCQAGGLDFDKAFPAPPEVETPVPQTPAPTQQP